MTTNNRFEVGDKVVLKTKEDLRKVDKIPARLSPKMTKQLEYLYKHNDYMVVSYVERIRLRLKNDRSGYSYMSYRFKRYNEFQLDEELFLV